MVTSLGFGHVGGVVCLVHPDRVLAALDDTAFAWYRRLRDRRERARMIEQLSIFEAARPAVRIRTDKKFLVPANEAYAGFEPEQAVLLDAASRRLEPGGPIVAGGAADRLAAPDAPIAEPEDF
jgi:fatty acid synthase